MMEKCEVCEIDTFAEKMILCIILLGPKDLCLAAPDRRRGVMYPRSCHRLPRCRHPAKVQQLAINPNDPDPPLSSASKVSAGFEDSRAARGIYPIAFNMSAWCESYAQYRRIGDNFANGRLPEHGTKCEPDQTAFEASGVEGRWWESL